MVPDMTPPDFTVVDTGEGRRRDRRRLAGRLVWLAYLSLYPAPWFVRPPTALGAAVSVLGLAAFLALYVHSVTVKRRSVLPHVLASAALGFLLSPFGGVWTVFNVYAAAFAGRLTARTRLWVMAGLQVALIGFGLLSGQPWFTWIWGVFFGVMTGFATAWQSDIEARNRELEAAQGEVRALAATAERERIARDLHDLLGHTLTLVAVKADLAARLADRDAGAARREMEEVAEAARGALGEVRAAVAGMAGAAFAVELERARRMLAAAHVAVDIRAVAPAADPTREAVLAMALREAVTNVIRHAGAHHCLIALECGPEGGLTLRVEDDGRGGEIREGSGLSGMRARLRAVGGDLAIRSGEAGARLLASLPAAA